MNNLVVIINIPQGVVILTSPTFALIDEEVSKNTCKNSSFKFI